MLSLLQVVLKCYENTFFLFRLSLILNASLINATCFTLSGYIHWYGCVGLKSLYVRCCWEMQMSERSCMRVCVFLVRVQQSQWYTKLCLFICIISPNTLHDYKYWLFDISNITTRTDLASKNKGCDLFMSNSVKENALSLWLPPSTASHCFW